MNVLKGFEKKIEETGEMGTRSGVLHARYSGCVAKAWTPCVRTERCCIPVCRHEWDGWVYCSYNKTYVLAWNVLSRSAEGHTERKWRCVLE